MNHLTLTPAEALAAAAGKLREIVREMEPQPPAKYTEQYLERGWLWSRSTSGEGSEQQDLWPLPTCPLGLPGETRWCREEWQHGTAPNNPHGICTWYAINEQCTETSRLHPDAPKDSEGWCYMWRKQAAESMPQWASRFTITNKSITIERRGGRWKWVVEVEVGK